MSKVFLYSSSPEVANPKDNYLGCFLCKSTLQQSALSAAQSGTIFWNFCKLLMLPSHFRPVMLCIWYSVSDNVLPPFRSLMLLSKADASNWFKTSWCCAYSIQYCTMWCHFSDLQCFLQNWCFQLILDQLMLCIPHWTIARAFVLPSNLHWFWFWSPLNLS